MTTARHTQTQQILYFFLIVLKNMIKKRHKILVLNDLNFFLQLIDEEIKLLIDEATAKTRGLIK